jgi:TolB-like protein
MLTKEGTTLGTAAYMSPEQMQGAAADHRTDIWALGVILYEMLAGEHPFKGESELAVMYSIMNEEPDPVTDLRSEIPMSMEQVVARALEKNPEKRYQHTAELLDDLRSISEGIESEGIRARVRKAKLHRRKKVITYAGIAGLIIIMTVIALSFFMGRAATIDSIAVLPLENLTGDAGQEYFVDQATDELIGQLAQIGALQVISRRAVMQYKGAEKPLSEIARELNVDAVVDGSVYEADRNVRIRVQLIDALPEERNLWAATYNRTKADVLVMYSEIARAIAAEIRVELTAAETARLTNVRQVNPEAYKAYSQGRSHWNKLTAKDLDTALQYFEEALEIDPNYAAAHAGVALVWQGRNQFRFAPRNEAVSRAKAAAEKALELDNTLAEAHYTLAMFKTWHEWDWDGAETAFRRAVELNPNLPDARAWYSHFLSIMGRNDEALRHIERAIELDPLNALFHGLYGMVLVYQRRYDDAIAAANTGLRLQPDLPIARGALQSGFILKGMRDEQLAIQRARIALDPERVAAFERGIEEGGYEGAQRGVADVLAAQYGKSGPRKTTAGGIAKRYLDAGDYDRTIEWLEKGYEDRDPTLLGITGPLYDPLRSNPRFQDLLRRMNLPQNETLGKE